MQPPFQSIVQVTLNTGRIRVMTRGESEAALIDKISACIQDRRPLGGSSAYLFANVSLGTATIQISTSADRLNLIVTAVMVWHPGLAKDAWTQKWGQANSRTPLPARQMPTQLPWLAVYVTPEGKEKSRAYLDRIGQVIRAAAWAISDQPEAAEPPH